VQSSPPFPPSPHPDEAPTVRLPRVPPGSSPRRNRLGSVTLAIVLVGAVFAVFPATAALGLLLCLLAIVPAIIAYRRSRKGRATDGGPALAAMVMAPVFFVVAACVVGATASTQTKATVPSVAGTVATAATAGPAAQQAVGTPEDSASAPAVSAAVSSAQAAAPVAASAPRAVPGPRHVAVAPVAAKPQPAAHVAVPAHQPQVAAPAPKPVPQPVAKPAPACDEATHYVNSSGNCVLRPVAAASAPAGATAKCGDGTYSSSQHRQGTCSRHGGVATWLTS
jgi:resuscitation-promoting factor RpfB